MSYVEFEVTRHRTIHQARNTDHDVASCTCQRFPVEATFANTSAYDNDATSLSCEVHCHITTLCRPCRRRAVASSDIADGLSRCVTSIWHGVLDFSTPRSHHSHSERYVCGHITLTSFSHHVHIIHHSHVPLTSHDSDHSVITRRSRGGRRGPSAARPPPAWRSRSARRRSGRPRRRCCTSAARTPAAG